MKHKATVIQTTITLADRERADAWQASCPCGYLGLPRLKPAIAERDGEEHVGSQPMGDDK